MKKISLISTAIVLAVLLAFSAFAASPINYETDENNAFDVTYTGTAGAYYAVVVVEGIAEEGTAPAITETSIQYIDQATADSNGTVSFEGILLKDDETPSTVWLGGSDLESAVLLGYVNNPSTDYVVSGTVTSDSSKEATVTLTSTTDEAKVYTVKTENGAYEVIVPNDTYKFVVTKVAHLSYTKNELAVAEDMTKDVTLVGGDTDESGKVDFDDLMSILNAYNTADEAADVDGTSIVDFDDLMIVLNNYNATNTVE